MSAPDFTPAYCGGRMPVLARNMVATSQPLAVQAGVHALQDGGNAVDAALAAAITLTVVEPTGNGIGGDAFALVWDGARLHGLNASGRSPAAASLADFAGRTAMPLRGWGAVTVPGCVSGWVALSQRFGKLPFARLFAAAIAYARGGFAVAPRTAAAWADAPRTFRDFPAFAPFLPGGRAPVAGENFSYPAQAETLEAIASSGGEEFYRGTLARKIAAVAAADGAKLSLEDLAAHRCEWVAPLAQDYRSRGHGGVTLHELPPNTQGLAALMMLRMVERFDIGRFDIDSPDFFHLQIEAMKLALADARRHIAATAISRVAFNRRSHIRWRSHHRWR
ncbi:MAG: gamma-glutamyltransferase, partial [Gammaproteobacteria bacterium]